MSVRVIKEEQNSKSDPANAGEGSITLSYHKRTQRKNSFPEDQLETRTKSSRKASKSIHFPETRIKIQFHLLAIRKRLERCSLIGE